MKEALYKSVNQGDKDFSALVSKMKEAKIAAIFYGGYFTEAGLLIRQAKEQGLDAVLMGGDALASEEYWKITGDTGQKSVDDLLARSAQHGLGQGRRRGIQGAGGYNPEGYTLYTYAAIQVFAQAADKAKSVKVDDLSKALHSMTVQTVVGPLTWDKKGDVTDPKYVFYIWKNGTYAEM